MSFPGIKGKAIVKSVLSGDTIIIRGKANNGPPSEAILQFTMITSPRVGYKTSEQDENYSFESRDFLRELLVGKEIQYAIEYTSSSNRHIGSASIPVKINEHSDLGKIIVSFGWAKIKPSKTDTEYQTELCEIEEGAKSKELGIWQVVDYNSKKVAFAWENVLDPRAFIAKCKGIPIPAIIEQVRNGSSFRCVLLLDDSRQWINLSLSGISCPILRKGIPNVDDLIEPFAEEAQYFVESRLLQKKIHLVLESIQGSGPNFSFFGTIQHPKGNISEILLSEGFAKIVDWNLGIVKDSKAYQAAESLAIKKNLRIWKDVTKQHTNHEMTKEYPAIVTKIISPDLLMVSSLKSPFTEKKIGFSSIRGPKRLKNESGFDVGYFFEAQEFLRSRLIGAKVLVKTDYIKPKDGEFEERECVTVFKNDKNISEMLVKMGYASVIKHRKDDNNRSSFYDLLVLAEEAAKSVEKGIHSKKDLPLIRIVDASENITKARSFIAQLQRHGSMKGIVEYVWSGSRFKIWLPSYNCRITFILAGVITPRGPSNQGQKAEPFGLESTEFSTKKVFQREVEITVESQDKVGGFIGTLISNQQNFGVLLLEEGFASTHHYSASQNPAANLLFAAESSAKNAKRGIWHNHTEIDDITKGTEEITVEERSAGNDAVVSEIGKTGKLYLQYLGPELEELTKLMKSFAEYHTGLGMKAASSFIPKLDDYCSAQFSADNIWYRAKIIKVVEKAYSVLYIDYGNSEVVPGPRLRTLPPAFSVSKLKPQANEAQLAYIDLPGTESEFALMAIDALCHFTEGQTLKAISLGPLGVLLLDQKGVSIQELLIREGLATITKTSMKKYQLEQRQRLKSPVALKSKKSDLDLLVEAQEETSRTRVNLWEYGAIGRYDEEALY